MRTYGTWVEVCPAAGCTLPLPTIRAFPASFSSKVSCHVLGMRYCVVCAGDPTWSGHGGSLVSHDFARHGTPATPCVLNTEHLLCARQVPTQATMQDIFLNTFNTFNTFKVSKKSTRGSGHGKSLYVHYVTSATSRACVRVAEPKVLNAIKRWQPATSGCHRELQ